MRHPAQLLSERESLPTTLHEGTARLEERPENRTQSAPVRYNSRASFGVFGVIEKNRQFDTAMPVLREVRRAWVPRIQIRSCVIGWEQ